MLSYIMNTPDAAEDGEEEEHFLDERPETIREVERAESPSSVLPMSFGGRSESCVQMSRRDLLLSPPFLAIVSASLLAIVSLKCYIVRI